MLDVGKSGSHPGNREVHKVVPVLGGRFVRRVRVGLISVLLVGLPIGAHAEQSALSEAGFGIGSAVASAVYGTAKIGYAVGGTVVGSLGWLMSGGRTDVGRAVMQPALRGDYVVTPDHLAGKKALSFVGRDRVLEPYMDR